MIIDKLQLKIVLIDKLVADYKKFNPKFTNAEIKILRMRLENFNVEELALLLGKANEIEI